MCFRFNLAKTFSTDFFDKNFCAAGPGKPQSYNWKALPISHTFGKKTFPKPSSINPSSWFWCKFIEVTNTKNYHGERYRSNFPQMFYKGAIPKNFANFAGLHLCWSLYFNKVDGYMSAALLKIDNRLKQRCLPVIFII